jgi:flagellar basal body-associated protein FliL
MNNLKPSTKKLNTSKKGVSTIITLILLLLISVVATLNFTDWFSELSVEILTDSESSQNKYSKSINLEHIYQNTNTNTLGLYYKNENNNFVYIDSISINGDNCTLLQGEVLNKKTTTLVEVSNCNLTSNNQANVVLYTDSEIVESSKLVD